MEVDEYVLARPAPELREHVAFYSGYRQFGSGVHRGLPSPWLTVILTLGEQLVITSHPDARQSPGRYDTLVGGLHLAPALIAVDGVQAGVQLAVHPLGCRALFGLPAAELAHVDVDFGAVAGRAVEAELRERLLLAADWPARFAAIDDVLARHVRERAVHPDVSHVFERLVRSGGGVAVAELAREVGWSARHLTDRFRAEVGLRPKQAARVARFDRARRLLKPGTRMADLAVATGFFDQAHFVREFQALAGYSPTRWLADEFGFVQAAGAVRGEDGRYD